MNLIKFRDTCTIMRGTGEVYCYDNPIEDAVYEGTNAPRSEAKAMGNGRYKDLKMAIIVSQYSASAAEIFTGAMQDWDRAVVVGRRTFGKGLVQRPIRFEDNSMMRLTVARYYTPSGRCVQKPYKKGNKKAYEDDIIDRSKTGEYYHIDSTPTRLRRLQLWL